MKKRLFALIIAFIMTTSTTVFAGQLPEETLPYDPGYTQEEIETRFLKNYKDAVANTRYSLPYLTNETFETTGRIPEISEPVMLYEAKLPVKVVDQNGKPVHNARIVKTDTIRTTENAVQIVFRERPYLNAESAGTIVTDTQGKAVIEHSSYFTETTLFVFSPELIPEYWNKFTDNTKYPECTRFDISVSADENPDEIVLQINLPETRETVAEEAPSLKLKVWHNSERSADYRCTLIKDVYAEFYAQFDASDPDVGIPQIGIIPPLPASVTTDKYGLAVFPKVEPGQYTMNIYAPGENKAIKTSTITVTEGKTSTRILLLRDEQ